MFWFTLLLLFGNVYVLLICNKEEYFFMKSKGFTLIELLIVIAIIGILASVVLGSLNTARTKATDAAIKSNLTNLRGAASIWYDDNAYMYASTDYSLAACPTATSTGNIFADSKIFSGVSEAYTKAGGASLSRCVALPTAWAVAVQLKTSDGAGNAGADAWCVDSVGASRQYIYTGVQTIADAITVDACS
ncbi:MAG: hypothetical protein UW27_C0017G0032 [Parcubacteria group bacterium GW2011_GWA1_44_13]|uniref:Uncharacterized protein n=1 Tax=Candidatus Nomurabacteria bacterium GW2011_GWB1_44_12 TaxID=1618748 RepID=A0A837I6W6_9BACT|nr:MAG: hypothetical protein UW25_C0004G0138 [Candidatus Nomurabacteria bacterium GW2011_GWB1_44_12]KKT37415.1 MAG: hypothetical protein UW27_C0017G0032 [Parcubacteria group bacterium GW2011_GWA1_44_13]KKT60885.1 MAG: hypothetical protein UW54_C0002G0007 [Parcubacteria group bacterium GW2011_GWC1_44_26]